MSPSPYILYTMPASLYSAKARSYLLAMGIDFEERPAGHPRYNDYVVPSLSRWIIPVLELPDGSLIQDSLDILDFLEGDVDPSLSAYPTGARQRAIAHVLEFFGGEGLLRPAMHYRWNFDEQNLAFLSNDFAGALAPGANAELRSQVFAMASDRMRTATGLFGVNDTTIPLIEKSYLEFLDLLSAHFETSPYLLGGRPTIGDFAFMGPMYPHLARDPYPSGLMKKRAWRVVRWVERMNTSRPDAGEYGEFSTDLFANDDIPVTLRELCRYIGEEMLPEFRAHVRYLDEWLDENPPEDNEIVGGKPSRRSIGSTTFPWRGVELPSVVMPYRLYVLQRLHDAVASMSPADQESVQALFEELSLTDLLTVRARRRVERRDNREVWGPAQEPVLP